MSRKGKTIAKRQREIANTAKRAIDSASARRAALEQESESVATQLQELSTRLNDEYAIERKKRQFTQLTFEDDDGWGDGGEEEQGGDEEQGGVLNPNIFILKLRTLRIGAS